MDTPNPMETIRSSQLRQFTNSLRHGENGHSSSISARYFSVVAERIEWSAWHSVYCCRRRRGVWKYIFRFVGERTLAFLRSLIVVLGSAPCEQARLATKKPYFILQKGCPNLPTVAETWCSTFVILPKVWDDGLSFCSTDTLLLIQFPYQNFKNYQNYFKID